MTIFDFFFQCSIIIIMKTLFYTFILVTISFNAWAQHSYTGGLQTEIKPTVSFKKYWKLNGKITTRTLFFEGTSVESFKGISVFERSELEMILTKDLSKKNSIGFGYLIRDEEGDFKQRFIQQFAVSKEATTFKYGHRFRFDETLQKGKDVIYRFRYRFSIEKSLSKINDKKTYFFVGNEYLPTLQGDDFSLETRIVPGIGFKLNDKNKLELGIDYRMEDLFTQSHKQIFLLNIAWKPSF